MEICREALARMVEQTLVKSDLTPAQVAEIFYGPSS